jgi:CRISPR-associated protein Cmr3
MNQIVIAPLDPVVARDGRPFNAGMRMKGLGWPYPSVLAGSLRTLLGKLQGGGFPEKTVQELKDIEIAGPLPLKDGQLYFPAAADLVFDAGHCEWYAARPGRLTGAAPTCSLPAGLRPALLAADIPDDFKSSAPPAFWSTERMTEWLVDPRQFPKIGPPKKPGPGFSSAPEREERTQTRIDPERGAAKDEMLFQTVALGFRNGMTMAARASAGNAFAGYLERLDSIHPMGGERRLAHWRTANPPVAPPREGKHKQKTPAEKAEPPEPDPWQCPGAIRKKLSQNPAKIRMVLATPAVFDHGWKPDWLRDGRPPGLHARSNLKLTLVSACVPRWQPISGWDFERKPMGPKPARRLVPAGSVFFFEASGDTSSLAGLWLRSVSDQDPDRKNGFGLALWGDWSE